MVIESHRCPHEALHFTVWIVVVNKHSFFNLGVWNQRCHSVQVGFVQCNRTPREKINMCCNSMYVSSHSSFHAIWCACSSRKGSHLFCSHMETARHISFDWYKFLIFNFLILQTKCPPFGCLHFYYDPAFYLCLYFSCKLWRSSYIRQHCTAAFWI